MNLLPFIELAQQLATAKGDHKRAASVVLGQLYAGAEKAVVGELASIVFHAHVPLLVTRVEALIEQEQAAVLGLEATVAAAAQARAEAERASVQAEADRQIKAPPRKQLGWEEDQKQRETLSAAVATARGELGRVRRELREANQALEAARVRLRGYQVLLADLQDVQAPVPKDLPLVLSALAGD